MVVWKGSYTEEKVRTGMDSIFFLAMGQCWASIGNQEMAAKARWGRACVWMDGQQEVTTVP